MRRSKTKTTVRRRMICVMASLCLVMLSSCESTDKMNETSITPTQTVTLTPTAAVTSKPVITQAADEEYPPMLADLSLNITDNYRTYYEIFVSSFCDSNQDGIGDLNGLISKLDYLNDGNPDTDTDLGVTGIWLMPVMPSQSYHKYDVDDYFSIDKSYGTMEDFKQLLRECKERNIKVIIDFVFNHTSDTNPWFTNAIEYIKSLKDGQMPDESECRYFGYYNFKQDMESKSNYYQIGTTNWYYEGVFESGMPDLNLSNEKVREEIEQIADYWIDLGVGGFRLDAVKEYYSGAATKNTEVLRWFCDYVKGVDPETYVVAEVWDSFGTIASYYKSGVDSIFNYALGSASGKIASTVNSAGNGKSGYNLGSNMKQIQDTFTAKNENYIDASFLSNHDNDRCAGYVSYKEDKVKMLGGINLMMSGSSFIYYGEELGMAGTGKDENKRAPMYWSEIDTSGMTAGPAGMEPQKAVFEPEDVQTTKEDSILNYYRRAIRLRNAFPEIAHGDVTVAEGADHDVTAVIKTYQDSSILLLMNVSDEEKVVTIPNDVFAVKGIAAALTTGAGQPSADGETITLPPYAIAILK